MALNFASSVFLSFTQPAGFPAVAHGQVPWTIPKARHRLHRRRSLRWSRRRSSGRPDCHQPKNHDFYDSVDWITGKKNGKMKNLKQTHGFFVEASNCLGGSGVNLLSSSKSMNKLSVTMGAMFPIPNGWCMIFLIEDSDFLSVGSVNI